MGLFDSLFGKKEEYPQLDAGSAAAGHIGKYRAQIEKFLPKVNDRLEVVPSQAAAYVFIGKPPKSFGLVWFNEGDESEHSFKSLMQQKNFGPAQIQILSDKLREVYTHSQGKARFSTSVGGKTLFVLPEEGIASEIGTLIREAS